ncbi:MAG: class I SAM-dependent methyltransferase [bacterium]|nr:class I SAM-dependent methyltransferase [bacterium]
MKTLKLGIENLSPKQRKFAHLIDPRFFQDNVNPFRKRGKSRRYVPSIDLDEELFHLHPFMDPSVLERGSVRRFPPEINKKYVWEKYVEDEWVCEGNNQLASNLEGHIKKNISELRKQDSIKLLDIGPCGGAVTTLFALRSLYRYGLLDKIEITLLDIVPNVLEATILGEFEIPREMIKEYGLEFIGRDGREYKRLLSKGTIMGVRKWYQNPENEPGEFTADALEQSKRNTDVGEHKVKYYHGEGETIPPEIRDYDVVLAGYLHHHMNLYGRQLVCKQMEDAAKKGGFIGVVDFYVKSYPEYMQWYKPHFTKYGDAPSVEYPLVDGRTIASFYKRTKIVKIDESLKNSFMIWGVRN